MILAIIQARMSSSRLPVKVMMEIGNKPCLQHIIERVSKSEHIDKVLVATSDKESDDAIELFCIENNVRCFRGNEEDVLDRFYKGALQENLSPKDAIVRITADCPLIDSNIIDKVIEHFNYEEFDYASNTNPPTFPDGLDVEIFTFEALEKAWKEAGLPSEREHVTPYIRKHPELFTYINLANHEDLSDHRWTLDEMEDYKMIEEVYKNLYRKDQIFHMKEVLEFLYNNREIKELNIQFRRNEGYQKSLMEDQEKVSVEDEK